MTTVRLGTRSSPLATTQTNLIADAVAAAGDPSGAAVDVEIVTITTEGDRNLAPLAQIGGTGVFVNALREALLDGRIDVAVHSLKDLPTTDDERFALAAIPARADARDALVARDGLTLGELPAGARVGTGSPRRAAQLNALGIGIEVVGVRGNVGTRIAKVTSGELDAVVLAYAGLTRLGRDSEATEVIDPLQMLPAPGQGALACECRADDDATIRILQQLDDRDTRVAVEAERSLLATLEAGCSAPVGALAEVAAGDEGDELWLRAVVSDPSGTHSYRLSASGLPQEAEAVGQRLAAELLTENIWQPEVKEIQ